MNDYVYVLDGNGRPLMPTMDKGEDPVSTYEPIYEQKKAELQAKIKTIHTREITNTLCLVGIAFIIALLIYFITLKITDIALKPYGYEATSLSGTVIQEFYDSTHDIISHGMAILSASISLFYFGVVDPYLGRKYNNITYQREKKELEEQLSRLVPPSDLRKAFTDAVRTEPERYCNAP